MRHAQEESLDLPIYLQAAIETAEAQQKEIDRLKALVGQARNWVDMEISYGLPARAELNRRFKILTDALSPVNVKLADAQDIELGHSLEGATSTSMTPEAFANSLYLKGRDLA